MKPAFIVIEGLEGAGKSTAIVTVCEWLKQRGLAFEQVREPGGTPLAEELRELIKRDWAEKVTAEAELLVMYAARSQLVENKIKPALQKGHWVVGDRHDLSSRAYQGGGRELGQELLAQISEITLQGFRPDLTLYLDITPEVGLQRARTRGALDRIEKEQISFFERTREAYQHFANTDNSIVTIDAHQNEVEVKQAIIDALEQQWPK